MSNKWHYKKAFSITESVKEPNSIDPKINVPSELNNDFKMDYSPYNGVKAGSKIDVDLKMLDIFGNQSNDPMDNPQDIRTFDVGYMDEVIGISNWPGVQATYEVVPDQDKNFRIHLNFDPTPYIPANGTSIKSCLEAAVKHRSLYGRIYYQIIQNDMTVDMKYSLGEISEVSDDLKRKLVCFIDEINRFLKQIIEQCKSAQTIEDLTSPAQMSEFLTGEMTVEKLLEENEELILEPQQTLIIPRYHVVREVGDNAESVAEILGVHDNTLNGAAEDFFNKNPDLVFSKDTKINFTRNYLFLESVEKIAESIFSGAAHAGINFGELSDEEKLDKLKGLNGESLLVSNKTIKLYKSHKTANNDALSDILNSLYTYDQYTKPEKLAAIININKECLLKEDELIEYSVSGENVSTVSEKDDTVEKVLKRLRAKLSFPNKDKISIEDIAVKCENELVFEDNQEFFSENIEYRYLDTIASLATNLSSDPMELIFPEQTDFNYCGITIKTTKTESSPQDLLSLFKLEVNEKNIMAIDPDDPENPVAVSDFEALEPGTLLKFGNISTEKVENDTLEDVVGRFNAKIDVNFIFNYLKFKSEMTIKVPSYFTSEGEKLSDIVKNLEAGETLSGILSKDSSITNNSGVLFPGSMVLKEKYEYKVPDKKTLNDLSVETNVSEDEIVRENLEVISLNSDQKITIPGNFEMGEFTAPNSEALQGTMTVTKPAYLTPLNVFLELRRKYELIDPDFKDSPEVWYASSPIHPKYETDENGNRNLCKFAENFEKVFPCLKVASAGLRWKETARVRIKTGMKNCGLLILTQMG